MIHVKHTHVMRCSHTKKNGSCQNCMKVDAMVTGCFKNSKSIAGRKHKYKYTLLCIFLCLALLGVGGYGSGGGSICCTVGARSFLSDRFSWTLAMWQCLMFQCGNAGTMNFVVWRKSTIRGPKVTCCVEESMQMPLWYPYIAGGWYEESDMTPPVGVDGTEYW